MQSMLSKRIFCWRLALVLPACIFVAIATPLSAADTSTPIATPVGTPAAEPVSNYGAWGLDLTAHDSNVRPDADFYGHANGHWLKTNTIPPDRVHVW